MRNGTAGLGILRIPGFLSPTILMPYLTGTFCTVKTRSVVLTRPQSFHTIMARTCFAIFPSWRRRLLLRLALLRRPRRHLCRLRSPRVNQPLCQCRSLRLSPRHIRPRYSRLRCLLNFRHPSRHCLQVLSRRPSRRRFALPDHFSTNPRIPATTAKAASILTLPQGHGCYHAPLVCAAHLQGTPVCTTARNVQAASTRERRERPGVRTAVSGPTPRPLVPRPVLFAPSASLPYPRGRPRANSAPEARI